MKHLTILVDMDDTIESLASAWIDYLNARHGTTTKLTDITGWDISKAFPMLTNEQVYAPLFEDDFWDCVKPIDGASETLQKLIADGHKVLIVTTSNYHTLASKMERVLFKYFPFLTWNDVIITSHKQLVNGDVLIDDGTHNLEGGNYFKILMTAQHNKKYDAEANGMLRVETWAEVYSAITLLAEEDDLKGWKEMPMEITLYSTGCPKCKVLKKKLKEKGIKYTENNSVDEMLSLGISQVPVLSVDNKLLDFSTANNWVNQQ
jgi:5'(3')-deoxyribonucleotidase/glutaredoxin